MFCCAAPFCIAGSILMVLLAMAITPRMSEHWGGWALMLIPVSAILGLPLGWMMMMLLFFRLSAI